MLSPLLLERLFVGISEVLNLSQAEEICFEANPATFTASKVQLFKDLGISRVSLGIQSFSDRVLKILGREHTREQAIESVKILQKVGIPEVNIDLMFAVPGQPPSEWEDTLRTAVSLNSDHISSYNLTYEEDTEFIDKLTKGEFYESEQQNADYFQLSHDILTAAGYNHYETSNYAKPGFESRHNMSYWQGRDYIGIGPSAVGTLNGERYRNIPDTAKYLQMINAVGHAQHEIETIDQEAYRLERVALMLRTTLGLEKKWLTPEGLDQALQLEKEGLIENRGNSIRLINEGPLLVDPIVERLI